MVNARCDVGETLAVVYRKSYDGLQSNEPYAHDHDKRTSHWSHGVLRRPEQLEGLQSETRPSLASRRTSPQEQR